jgi:hypothetical protein
LKIPLISVLEIKLNLDHQHYHTGEFMKIKSIEISGLFGRKETMLYEFNNDLNILTGRNGSGKTTILKLVWSIISGNISLAIKEINFSSCTLKTDNYECSIKKTSKNIFKVVIKPNDDKKSIFKYNVDENEDGFGYLLEEKAKSHFYLINQGCSLFFPTFRRIEGGFSLGDSDEHISRIMRRTNADLDEILTGLSKRLTNKEHHFISAISSKDINNLLLQKYTDYSEIINLSTTKKYNEIIEKIRHFEENKEDSNMSASDLLLKTKKDIEELEENKLNILSPLEVVNSLVRDIFNHSGISFGKRLSLGDSAKAINSNVLSAGEKQMLSFVCYNAFYSDAIILIDEPELSLHVDWQRQLYTILEKQNNSNQFIFATHSPFIYAKYTDKEIIINTDRGNIEGLE